MRIRLMNTVCAVGVALTLVLPRLFAATLHAIETKADAHHAAVYCTFSSIPSYRSFMLENPYRAVIDFQTTNGHPQFRLPNDQGLIKSLRIGYPNANTLRLVVELHQPAHVSLHDWKPNHPGTQGLQIDLNPKSGRVAFQPRHVNPVRNPLTVPHHPSAQISRPSTPSHPIIAKHAPTRSGRDIIIVVDAGHGGKDPGAKGPRKSLEKNVVLNIALKLKQLINQQPGMRAVLTRDGDYYIGLRERLNITRKYNADMFVSIHADAFINQNSNGASVYALSPRGATSEAARWLAEKENYSELGGVDLSTLDDQNQIIRSVLLDLSQTATISASLQIGGNVLQHLDHMTTLHHNSVEQAGFMVLKSPDIPSILVETGFISNPREENNLTSPAYQSQLTFAIFNGIKRYFWDHPPQGSRMEAMTGGSGPYLAMAQPRSQRIIPTKTFNTRAANSRWQPLRTWRKKS